MAALLKLTLLFALVVLVASATAKSQSEDKEVQVEDGKDDFPSDESVRIEGDDETEEDRIHKKKKKPHHGLAGFLADLIKLKPIKKSEEDPQKSEEDPKKVHIVKKTKVVEVTKRVVVNPVCMTVHGKKPECSPHIGPKSNEDEGLFYVESTVAPKMGDFILSEEDEDQIAMSRSARYLSFGSATPEIAEVKSSIEEGEIEELSEEEEEEEVSVDEMGRFIFHKKKPKKVTSIHTIFVTKVQKVTDYKVTATLSAENCVPANIDLDIPLCPKKPDIKNPIKFWKEEETKEMDVTEKDIEVASENVA